MCPEHALPHLTRCLMLLFTSQRSSLCTPQPLSTFWCVSTVFNLHIRTFTFVNLCLRRSHGRERLTQVIPRTAKYGIIRDIHALNKSHLQLLQHMRDVRSTPSPS